MTSVPTVPHHDEARSKVSQTAFAVAKFRAVETESENRLLNDPFAKLFLVPQLDFWYSSLPEIKRGEFINGIAVRTYRIDQELMKGFEKGISQVVVVGAGLDCRPWRLGDVFSKHNLPIKSAEIKWFEVDFPDVFHFKGEVLKNSGAQPVVDYRSVGANVGIEDVVTKLKEAGYDSSKPTIWLLEGFTSYLTEEELKGALSNFSANSAAGSYMISTFNGTKFESITAMHRFKTDTPLEFVQEWGWSDGTCEELYNKSVELGRLPAWKAYFLITATLHK